MDSKVNLFIKKYDNYSKKKKKLKQIFYKELHVIYFRNL